MKSKSRIIFSTLLITSAILLSSTAIAYPPDNAAVLYYKTHLSYQKPEGQVANDLNDVIKGEIEPSKEMVKFIKAQKKTIDTLITAANIKNCDWGYNYAEGFDMLIPGLSDMRNLTKIVLADAVINASQGKYNIAVDRCIAVYGMARHVKDQVIINNLVAIAMEDLANTVIANMLPDIAKDQKLMTKLRNTLNDTAVDHNRMAVAMKSEVDTVTMHMTPQQIIQTALEATQSEAKLKDMPEDLPAKGVAFYKQYMNVIINALSLPYTEAIAEIKKNEAKLDKDAKSKPEAMLTSALTPAFGQIINLSTKSDTALNALRTALEVYRIKAVTGKLPEILPAGCPKDRFSNRDFIYNVTEEGFTLTSPVKNDKTGKHETYQYKIK